MTSYEIRKHQALVLESGEVKDIPPGESIPEPNAWVGWNFTRSTHSVLFQEMSEIYKSPLGWDETTIGAVEDEKFTQGYLDVPFDGVFVIRTAVEEGGWTYYKFEFISEEGAPPDEKIMFKFGAP